MDFIMHAIERGKGEKKNISHRLRRNKFKNKQWKKEGKEDVIRMGVVTKEN